MDPRETYLSTHFRLSDFMGTHSGYSAGIANDITDINPDHTGDMRHFNGEALCVHGLEPILDRFGPLSIAYGAISEEFSKKTVRYQDPLKPSHHLWNLGAAADIVVHKYVQGLPNEPLMRQLFEDNNTGTSPASLAHGIDELGVPYSRLISYSESPYLCLAISAIEVLRNTPRKAFYENRFEGVPKAKPLYIQQASFTARSRVSQELQETGLPAPWEGAGHPTYHGGGRKQYQHTRVSKYTMLIDWLFDYDSIINGWKNQPALHTDSVQDALAAAGTVYDALIDRTGHRRFSILSGYLNPSNPGFVSGWQDWRGGQCRFTLGMPDIHGAGLAVEEAAYELPGVETCRMDTRGETITLEFILNVEDVLNAPREQI